MSAPDPLAPIEALADDLEANRLGVFARLDAVNTISRIRDALTEAREAVDALVAERDAMQKAANENYSSLRVARRERDAAREALGRVEAQIEQQPSCGVASRDHDGCFVADSLRIARAALAHPATDATGETVRPLAHDGKPGCPVTVWDGPYSTRCSAGAAIGRCAYHGSFAQPATDEEAGQ